VLRACCLFSNLLADQEIVRCASLTAIALQATEQQLYDLFAPIGEILELYILRNSNGKSRGCAFVTYANKFLAQQAITQLNGKQVRLFTPPCEAGNMRATVCI
jgi:RNA recognition motif-containing protein